MGAEEALDALNNAYYKDGTEQGNVRDATSLENMKTALEWIKECNELRKSHGLSELMVSDRLMAISQSNTNASAYILNHTHQFGVGENLAWGYQNPFDGWYTEEKNCMILELLIFRRWDII